MDLYKFHANSAILQGYKEAKYIVPDRIRKVIFNNRQLHPKQLKNISKHSNLAFYYALTLKRPFPEGEDAISKVAKDAMGYARYVIKGPWPKGEDAIAKNSHYKRMYLDNFGVKL